MSATAKRKHSSDAVSVASTVPTEEPPATEPSTTDGGPPLDERSQQLADQRREHAACKLKLKEQASAAREQRTAIQGQLEQLEGIEDGGTADLRRQLQTYAAQEADALAAMRRLEGDFEAAVARILGLPPGQPTQQLEAALQEQQLLQAAQVQQLAVEQQLGASEFAVTDSSKRSSKKARLDRMSHVWDWLHHANGGAAVAAGAEAAPGAPVQAHLRSEDSRQAQVPAMQQQAQSVQPTGAEEPAGQRRSADRAAGTLQVSESQVLLDMAQGAPDKHAQPSAAATAASSAEQARSAAL